MNTNSPSGVIKSVPIIGIQYEVQSQSNGIELQIEYLALNPEMVEESLMDPEDINLPVLWDLLNSGLNLYSSLQSKQTKQDLLFSSFIKNDDAKMFLSALNVALDSDIVDKLVVIKDIKTKSEYLFDGDIH